MAFRRFNSSRGRSFSFSSRFRKPMAKAKFLWVNQLTTVGDLTTGAKSAAILSPSLWVMNASSGNLEKVKLVQMLLNFTFTPLTTLAMVPQASRFALYVDDTTAGGAGDPTTVTFYDECQPFHIGEVGIQGFNNAVVNAAPHFAFNGFRDNQRRYRVNRLCRTDQSLFISMSGIVATSGTSSISCFVRCLVKLDP